jgi:hypothetical protein
MEVAAQIRSGCLIVAIGPEDGPNRLPGYRRSSVDGKISEKFDDFGSGAELKRRAVDLDSWYTEETDGNHRATSGTETA